MSHSRDYSEEIASAIDEEVRRLIESAHDEAWEILVQYRDVLDNLVLQLMEHETLTAGQVLEIFSPIHERPTRGSYTGYGKRLPSDRPPVLTPKELALTHSTDRDQSRAGNGQAVSSSGDGAQQALGPGPADGLGGTGNFGFGANASGELGGAGSLGYGIPHDSIPHDSGEGGPGTPPPGPPQ